LAPLEIHAGIMVLSHCDRTKSRSGSMAAPWESARNNLRNRRLGPTNSTGLSNSTGSEPHVGPVQNVYFAQFQVTASTRSRVVKISRDR
jgi:hypothetical protein